jgi:YjbE family integral membrane protein
LIAASWRRSQPEAIIEIALDNPVFWIAVLQIIAIDIVLGGDNAVVIALASRRLPVEQRNRAIFWGVFGAIALRVVLIFFALYLLSIPYLKVVGAALLLWIGVKLLLPEREGEGHHIDPATSLYGAVKTIIVADAVMSLDNVIAIAGAAKGSLGLVIFGLVVSVPIIVWGSKLVLTLMDRFPIVIAIGAGLLGWIAGDMLVTDVALADWFELNVPYAQWIVPAVGAIAVIAAGKWLGRKAAGGAAERPIDLAAAGSTAALVSRVDTSSRADHPAGIAPDNQRAGGG